MEELALSGEKRRIRERMRSQIGTISPGSRRTSAILAAENLFQSGYWLRAECLLVYLAMESELNTDALILEAWKVNKGVFGPRIEKGDIRFAKISSFEDSLTHGKYGIRIPNARAELWDDSTTQGSTLIIVPGLAFDEAGGRLGRGGGFYDRLISRLRKKSSSASVSIDIIGFAFEQQVIENVPRTSEDEPMDALITDERILDFR